MYPGRWGGVGHLAVQMAARAVGAGGFVETAKTRRRGGIRIVLGVGPRKTTRLVETHSPVDAILAERGAKHVNINLLRYFSEPATLDSKVQAFLQRGMALAMEWATQGLVVPSGVVMADAFRPFKNSCE